MNHRAHQKHQAHQASLATVLATREASREHQGSIACESDAHTLEANGGILATNQVQCWEFVAGACDCLAWREDLCPARHQMFARCASQAC